MQRKRRIQAAILKTSWLLIYLLKWIILFKLHVNLLAFKHVEEVSVTLVSKLLSGIENWNNYSFFNFKISRPFHHTLFSLKFLLIPRSVIKCAGLNLVLQSDQFSISVLLRNMAFSKTAFYECFELFVDSSCPTQSYFRIYPRVNFIKVDKIFQSVFY